MDKQQVLYRAKRLLARQDCPEATQDIATNLANRQNAIDTANYGPLNPNETNEEYWTAKADMFQGDVETAKKARCGNCSFFDTRQNMLDCIATGIGTEPGTDPYDVIDAGQLGYCEAFDFKCAASRTCDAWVAGGPITDETETRIDPRPFERKDKFIQRCMASGKMVSEYPDSSQRYAVCQSLWSGK